MEIETGTTAPAAPDPERVTLAEAAALLGVHPNTVRNRIKRGLLPAERVMTLNGEAYAIPKAALTPPSQQFRRVTTGSNPLVSSLDTQSSEENDTVVTPTKGLQVTLTTALQHVVVPLAEANARQAEELTRLHEVAHQQAEELGRLRERLAAIEAARSPADVENGARARVRPGCEGRRGERAELWEALAARTPAAPPPPPQPEPLVTPPPRPQPLWGWIGARLRGRSD